jgi:tetratricopeptide (TPR) repeat protein
MQHSYKLPERSQFYIKIGYYQSKQDPEKAMAVLRMIIKLYPEDLMAHSLMAYFLSARNRWDEAVKTYERMLEIDPKEYEIFQKIGAQYEAKGDFSQALNFYNKFAEHFPNNPESFRLIGGLNKKMGNYEKAKDYYEKALILKPDSIPVLTELANIEVNLGNVDTAAQQFREALQFSKTAEEKENAYDALASFCRMKGQMKKALEYTELMIKALEEYSVPFFVVFAKIFSVADCVNAGEEEKAFRRLASLESTLSPPLDKYISIGYLFLYLELEKPGEAEQRLPGVQDLINTFGNEQLRFLLHYARGEINEMRGEYAEAIKSYEASLKIIPTRISVLRRIGRCYRHLKHLKKAEESIQKTLKIHPFDPKSNYEMALVYLEIGDKEKALNHLKIASEVWKDADPDYKPAQLAREKLNLL